MKKVYAPAVALCILLPAAQQAADKAAAKGDLDGTWLATSFEQDGRSASEGQIKDFRMVVSKGEYRFASRPLPFARGSLSGGVTTDPAARPREVDFIPSGGVYAGKPYRGIYKVEGDTLEVCFAIPPMKRPAEFASRPNSGVSFAVFKRQGR